MKEFSYPITDILSKGLAPNYNKRNQPFLIQSIGALPYENALLSLEQFSTLDLPGMGFPFPQLFVFSDVTVIATETALFELIDNKVIFPVFSTLTQENGGRILQENDGALLTDVNILNTAITNLPVGGPWVGLDFKTYLYFTNGVVAVTKDSATGLFSIDTTVPFAQAACNFNGQVLLGAPNLP